MTALRCVPRYALGARLRAGAVLTLASVDLGLRSPGWATWRYTIGYGAELLGAGVVPCPSGYYPEVVARELAEAVVPVPSVCVVEWPRKYATFTAAHEDIASLQAVGKALPWRIAAKIGPFTWKGNVPKEITHARLATALGADAWARVPDSPDARDAVGVGAYALGIVGRGCTRVVGVR